MPPHLEMLAPRREPLAAPATRGAASLPPLASLDDGELVVRSRAGDRAAYGELFRRHEPLVRRRAWRLTGSSEVEDLVAETFAAVLRALLVGRGPTTDVRRYLLVTVRNTAADAGRRRSREVPHHAGADVFLELPGERVTVGPVAEAMARLSPRHRQVLWWREVEGWSMEDLGAELGLSPNAAAALAYRARRALQDAYAAAIHEEAHWAVV